jgi:predicted dehydrogenase
LGSEPEVAGARAVFEDGVDAEMAADLHFPGGVRARIACSMTPPRTSAWLRVESERGVLEIDNYVAPQLGCRFTTTAGGETTEHPTEGQTTYAAQLEHLHAVARLGEDPSPAAPTPSQTWPRSTRSTPPRARSATAKWSEPDNDSDERP